MLGTLGLFGGLFTAWWLLLWWGLPISWQKISPTALLLLHIAPPIALGVVWKIWQKIRATKLVEAQAANQEAAEAERAAQREAARQQHLAALAERHTKVHCRGVWAQAMAVKDEPQWLGDLPDGVFWSALIADEVETGESDALAAVSSSLLGVLTDLYGTAPGAAWLPHYFEAHTDKEGREQLEAIQGWQKEAIAAQYFETEPTPEIRFLPGSGSLIARVQQLLQQNPAMPGVVICAADAPLVSRGQLDDWDEPDANAEELNRWLGMPGYTVLALVFLRDTLPEPAAALAEQDSDEQDVYTPYWEKQAQYGDELWGRVPNAMQPSLYELPMLAELRLAEQAQIAQKQLVPMTRQIHTLFENALVNAELRDYPFSEADRDEAKDQASSIAWLIHNSGDAAVGGHRLAAISSALHQFEVPINPIDEASNCVREWGDVGSARSILQAAVAIVHAARLQAPTVLAEFESRDSVDQISVALFKPAEQAA